MSANQETMAIISRINISAEEMCRCQAEGFYGSLSKDELDELSRAGVERTGGAEIPEPWATRMESVTLKCMVGPVEPDSLYAKCEPDSSVSSSCGKYILGVIKRAEFLAEENLYGRSCAPDSSDQDRLDAVLEFMFAHPSLRLEAPKNLVARAYKSRFCPHVDFKPAPDDLPF